MSHNLLKMMCLFKGLRKLTNGFSAFLLSIIFFNFIVAVIMRFVFNSPIPWTEELTIIIFSWVIFIQSAFGLRFEEQMRFEVLYELMSEKKQRLISILSYLIFSIILLAAIPACLDYALFMHRQKTPALGIHLSYVYLSFPIFLFAVAARMLYSALMNIYTFNKRNI